MKDRNSSMKIEVLASTDGYWAGVGFSAGSVVDWAGSAGCCDGAVSADGLAESDAGGVVCSAAGAA